MCDSINKNQFQDQFIYTHNSMCGSIHYLPIQVLIQSLYILRHV